MSDAHDDEIKTSLPISLGDPKRFPSSKSGVKGDFDGTVNCSMSGCIIGEIK